MLWNKSVTGKTEAELQCLADILRAGDVYLHLHFCYSTLQTLLLVFWFAGNTDVIPHIDKKVAKQLDKQLSNSGWQQPVHCQKLFKDKMRYGKWKQVDGTAEPTLCKHSLLLQYNEQHVLPREGWQLAADAALQQIQLSPSTPDSMTDSQYIAKLLQIFKDNNICRLSRQYGISDVFVKEYVRQLQVHSSAAESQASTQMPSQLPLLPNDELEMHSVLQQAVSQTPDPVTAAVEQQKGDMLRYPGPKSDAAEPSFVQLNDAAFDCLKLEWEQKPKETARCTCANYGIWDIYDASRSAWVSVCLSTNFCCCGEALQFCEHIRLARLISACNNDPSHQTSEAACAVGQPVVYAAQQPFPTHNDQKADSIKGIFRLCEVSDSRHVLYIAHNILVCTNSHACHAGTGHQDSRLWKHVPASHQEHCCWASTSH